MKIVIIGGHITPALATMDALVKLDSKVEFFFIGRKHTREGDKALSAEYLLMTQKGIKSYSLTTGRLQRQFTRYTIPSLFKIPYGLYQSLAILREIKPDVICAFGGYLAVPVVIAGWLLKIPSITHEQTLIPGLANKIVSRFVQKIALSFEDTKKYYPYAHTVVTGNPIRSEISVAKGNFILDKKELPVIYITGGNQGAHPINELIFNILPQLLTFAHVVHQTGNATFFNDFSRAKRLEQSYAKKYAGSYTVFDYVTPDLIGDVFSYSDIVISRSGINTLCELLYLAKRAILIPIPLHREQEYNADFFSQSGLGVALSQERLSPERLLKIIQDMLGRKITESDALKAKAMVLPDAAGALARVIHDIV
ncbi:MAG: UDP-N-acetylglucosamine--N-acetylmuramyl-(pentapeptide) pyrophosphoryl-undecaprenol N-acetylglucosamine transferase [bacterium]|nr:UDP-N-acetylglucosamine--N-acetylmuramyl-(pentapeptide) pyrophosphoryl-undecaprenol N-acetylglucosamine transferase [bacterium]